MFVFFFTFTFWNIIKKREFSISHVYKSFPLRFVRHNDNSPDTEQWQPLSTIHTPIDKGWSEDGSSCCDTSLRRMEPCPPQWSVLSDWMCSVSLSACQLWLKEAKVRNPQCALLSYLCHIVDSGYIDRVIMLYLMMSW